MSRLTRPDLEALPNYVPGRSPADLARELGLPEDIVNVDGGAIAQGHPIGPPVRY